MFGDVPAGWAPARMGQRQMKSPNPFSGGVDALSDADFALLVDAVETRRCRELVGAGTYDEAARKWRPRPRCPSCSYEGCASDGSTPAGHRAWSCGRCGRKFNSLTGTVFENAKRALWRWVVFIRLMCFNVQLDACGYRQESCALFRQPHKPAVRCGYPSSRVTSR